MDLATPLGVSDSDSDLVSVHSSIAAVKSLTACQEKIIDEECKTV